MKTLFTLRVPIIGKQQAWNFFASATGCVLLSMLLCSCESATYDVRQIHQPIVLNNNPFLAPANASSLGIRNVDKYIAMVSESDVSASSGYATTTSHGADNQAQVGAFNKIGGQSNRAIRNVSLDTDFWAMNVVFGLAEQESIIATGDVAEFQYPATAASPAPTNAVVSTGDTASSIVTNSAVKLNTGTTNANNSETVTNEMISAPPASSKGINP